MIALVASLMLGLYVLLPVLIFERTLSAFVPAKKINRGRTEEIAFGALVIVAPLVLAFLLSHYFWFFGHHPYPLNEAGEASAGDDYRVAVMALESDKYLTDHESKVWLAVEHIRLRQTRFLVWTYCLLLLQCFVVIVLTKNYGRWRCYRVYRWVSAPLVRRVSPWHLLFTTFTFDPREPRSVNVDVVVTSGELFTGTIGEEQYIVNPDGSLCGLLLTGAKRYKRSAREEDRKREVEKKSHEYWTLIAGDGQFYIPAGVIANINIRYQVPESELKNEIEQRVRGNKEILRILDEYVPTPLEITFNKPSRRQAVVKRNQATHETDIDQNGSAE